MKRLHDLFAELGPGQAMPLDGVYTEDIVFTDPFHHIEGRDALREYFEGLNENVKTCTFDFHELYESAKGGVTMWTMTLRLQRGPKKAIVVEGASHVRYRGGLVCEQRDYFDAGEMVYEHVPLLGSAIRQIKKRM